MKKLNLLMPDVHTGYLGSRQKERVRYLSVPTDLNSKKINEDLENGDVMFGALREQMKKAPCRTVVIRTNSEEAGLMAVSYLAAHYNRLDHRQEGIESEDGLSDTDEFDLSEDSDYDEDFIADEDDEVWEECAYRIPLIDIGDIQMFDGSDSFDTFQDRSFNMQGNGYSRQKDPYWTNCTHESVCFMTTIVGYGSPYFSIHNTIPKYFQKNRHIYIVEVNNEAFTNLSFGGMSRDEEDSEDTLFVSMVLEEAAAVVDLFYEDKEKKEELLQFRKTQFENWIAVKGLTLADGFPTEKIVSQILKMRNFNKSELMGQILKYMQIQAGVSGTVTEQDFDILRRFARIGAETESKASSASKLEKQLYGMENVKQQVREVVEVMRYQKRRENFGLQHGGYHNVHLLIGAPGTAKTTVARLMGNMMAEAHLLPGNRFICVNGADLKGLYVGHTAPKVRKIFSDNDIIMIDEAYSLTAQGDGEGGDSFSHEALAEIITQIEDYGTKKLVMFAGYGGTGVSEKDNLMKIFIDSNPGLKSRINSTIFFESYTPEQMVEIVHIQAKIQNFILTRSSDSDILKYFKERVSERDFGNGREARSLLENAMVFAAERVRKIPNGKITKRKLQEISASDIKKALDRMRVSNRMQAGRSVKRRMGFG